jgi:hypothetical protein
MKAKDTDILIIPGYTNSGPGHWQSRWQSKLSTARRVEQREWSKPVRDDWIARVAEEANRAERPILLVAHSLGIPTAIHALPDVANPKIRPKHLMTFGPYPREPLPFPSVVVASRNDEFCAFDVAEDIAAAWGSLFVDAGEAGHLNAESGYGPWPEGSLLLAKFLSRL